MEEIDPDTDQPYWNIYADACIPLPDDFVSKLLEVVEIDGVGGLIPYYLHFVVKDYFSMLSDRGDTTLPYIPNVDIVGTNTNTVDTSETIPATQLLMQAINDIIGITTNMVFKLDIAPLDGRKIIEFIEELQKLYPDMTASDISMALAISIDDIALVLDMSSGDPATSKAWLLLYNVNDL